MKIGTVISMLLAKMFIVTKTAERRLLLAKFGVDSASTQLRTGPDKFALNEGSRAVIRGRFYPC